jgi:hypothetical protein
MTYATTSERMNPQAQQTTDSMMQLTNVATRRLRWHRLWKISWHCVGRRKTAPSTQSRQNAPRGFVILRVKETRSQIFVMTGYSAAHHRPCIGAGITESSQWEGEGNDDPQPRTNTKSSPLGHITHANVTLELSMGLCPG